MLSAAPASWLRVQNLAFTDNQVSAIYDWDSVALVPEPALVGSASVMHPIDGRLERTDPLPTLAQLDGFVADYEAVRGAPFSDHDTRSLPPANALRNPAVPDTGQPRYTPSDSDTTSASSPSNVTGLT